MTGPLTPQADPRYTPTPHSYAESHYLRHNSSVGRPNAGRSTRRTTERPSGAGLDPDLQRFAGHIGHCEHVHVGQADKQFAHARRISGHRGSRFCWRQEPPESQNPCTASAILTQQSRTHPAQIRSAAKELGIYDSSLWNWVRQAREEAAGAPTTAERAEIRGLKKELEPVKREREILGKATAYFSARDPRNG